jgi:site-specific recombinase XerD
LGLYPRDLDPTNGTVNVVHGKGGRQRIVGLDPAAFAVVERWLDKRRELGLNGHQPVFCTLRGAPLKPSYIRAMFPRLARRAGIEKRVHAHGLRHTHAAELAAENVPMNVIARQLGHRSVATTSRYIDHIQPTQVIETMRQREWSF